MRTRITPVIAFAAASLLSASANAEQPPHWSYSGKAGPEHWGELAPDFSACAAGKNQSPVNLSTMVEGELSPIQFAYKAAGSEVVNNGHAIQVNYGAGSSITVDGRSFELKQFHFHSPSENTIEGTQYPLEAHLVHADSAGNLAVVAVMFQDGAANAVIAPAWAKMPAKAGDSAKLDTAINAESLLPANKDYYRFNGSLTTPPCSEGVIWLVMKTAGAVSKEQIAQFNKAIPFANNRPVQPLNARIVVK